MNTTEPHADRRAEPILAEAKGYAPKRARWPGLLAVAVLAAAAIGGMLVTGRNDAQHGAGPPDRSVQSMPPQAGPATPPAQAEPATPPAQDDTRIAQPAKPAQPAQP